MRYDRKQKEPGGNAVSGRRRGRRCWLRSSAQGAERRDEEVMTELASRELLARTDTRSVSIARTTANSETGSQKRRCR